MEANAYAQDLDNWVDRQRAAVSLLNSIGNLMYNHSIELVLFRNELVDCSVSEILSLHEYGRKTVNKPIDVFTSSELAQIIESLHLVPSKIDIGRLANEWLNEQNNYDDKVDFITDKLKDIIGDPGFQLEPKDVVLFGFGRIGRLLAREIIKSAGKGQQLRLRAVVVRGMDQKQLVKRAALLKNDSVHGAFKGNIEIDEENMTLVINGQRVKMINSGNPEDIDYTQYGINNALLLDNTGVFRDRTALSRHLQANGISKVILTAPGKEVPNIVYGVNHLTVEADKEDVFSAASCTTNAITPILKVIEDELGVVKGHIETVHAYTNDQNLLDNMHKKYRRGRSAAVNMVITETGAGKAVTKAIPSLQNKLTANAVRVPTPNGSLAILNLEVGKETTVEGVQEILKKAAFEGALVNQINYSTENELVSSDIVGNVCCSIYDSPATLVHPDGKSMVLYVWYDNEFGYTKQVIRLAKYVAKVNRLKYY